MKKLIKFIIGIMVGIIILFIIDIICIFTINKPIFAIKEDNGDSVDIIYRGILYDTIICHESLEPRITLKVFSYSCSNNDINYVLEDKTKKIKDFVCAEALESFYEDEKYTYYWDCIKNEYMVARYENGYEETIAKALEQKNINIQILDKFDINYIKEEK